MMKIKKPYGQLTSSKSFERYQKFKLMNKTFSKHRNFLPFKEIDDYLNKLSSEAFKTLFKKDFIKRFKFFDDLKKILVRSLAEHEKEIPDYRTNQKIYIYNLSKNLIILNFLNRKKKLENPFFEIFKLIESYPPLYPEIKIPKTFEEFNSSKTIPLVYLCLRWYVDDKKIILDDTLQKKIENYEKSFDEVWDYNEK